MDDPNQIYLIEESQKKNAWWINILIPGLWQILNGEVGRGICLLFMGVLIFFFEAAIFGAIFGMGFNLIFFCTAWIIPPILATILSYKQCKEYNNQLDFIAHNKIKENKSIDPEEKDINVTITPENGTVKSAWIFTIEKLKTDDKSLMTCIWA